MSFQQPTVCYTGFIPEIGQWGSNGPPSVILGGHFSKKGVQERYLIHQTLCRYFETFWATEKPGLKLLRNPGRLSGEIMTQTKKRKAIETVRGYKSSK